MKSIKDYILESKKFVDQTTIGDFAKWACLAQMPDGKEGKVEAEDCEDLLANGWFEYFDENSGLQDIADFLNKNWNENIKVTSEETPNDWEISFTFDGKEYTAAYMRRYGDLDD